MPLALKYLTYVLSIWLLSEVFQLARLSKFLNNTFFIFSICSFLMSLNFVNNTYLIIHSVYRVIAIFPKTQYFISPELCNGTQLDVNWAIYIWLKLILMLTCYYLENKEIHFKIRQSKEEMLILIMDEYGTCLPYFYLQIELSLKQLFKHPETLLVGSTCSKSSRKTLECDIWMFDLVSHLPTLNKYFAGLVSCCAVYEYVFKTGCKVKKANSNCTFD